ncbi:MAG: choice-of-anchor D domain-containing protein [Candidatus Polarisedimenticolia bacterium]
MAAVASEEESTRRRHDLSFRVNSHEETISLAAPAAWSLDARQLKNTRRLSLDLPGDETAQVNILFEPRLDRADALKQIREYAAIVQESERVMTTIDGWPALRIRKLVIPPPPDHAEVDVHPELRIRTMIAVGTNLVIVNASLPANASPALEQQAIDIASSLDFRAEASPEEVGKELESLRAVPAAPTRPPAPIPSEPQSSLSGPLISRGIVSDGANARINTSGNGELEIATDPTGKHVVVALQSRRWVSSNDGGSTFPNSGTIGAGNGDPSVAWGQSGRFYQAWIHTNCQGSGIYQNPVPVPELDGIAGTDPIPNGMDCTGIARSDDNGVSFGAANVNPAVVCIGRAPAGQPALPGECFPDQEHIAADRWNPGTAPGNDQIYSTWRNFSPNGQDAALVCSADSGATWTNQTNGGAAEITAVGVNEVFPRITVGRDGFVYVATYDDLGMFRLYKFNSCVNGLGQVAGWPVNVAARDPFQCPFAGHDRCDQNPTSQTVIVDGGNANHVYYAYVDDAGNGTTGDSNILVRDSLDGGQTWLAGRVVQANSAGNARRVMPWLCTTGGDAVVTWYTQAGALPTDSTDYNGGRVGLDGMGNLVAKEDFTLSQVPDTWCDLGWPCQTRWGNTDTQTSNPAEACPTQPQIAGVCGDGDNPNVTPDSGNLCDFSDDDGVTFTNCQPAASSPSGNNELCLTGGGCPTYGDYNGTACTGGKLFAAWASANAPAGLSPPDTSSNPGVLFDVINLDVDAPVITIPGSVRFGDVCPGGDVFATLEICNTGGANLQVDTITSDDPDFAVTVPSSGFPVTISPDFCFPFEVRFTPGSAGLDTAILSIPSDDPDRPVVTVEASANVGAPDLQAIIANAGAFGNVCTGNHADLNLNLLNQGNCNLTISSITINQAGTSFQLPVALAFPIVLSPDADFTIPIRYAPQACDGPVEDATIVIEHDDPSPPPPDPMLIPISGASPCGNLIIDPVTVAAVHAFPATVADAAGTLGCFSDRSVVLRNNGACPVRINGITAAGVSGNPADYGVTAPTVFPILLPAGEETLNVTVRFTPHGDANPLAPSQVTGLLTVLSDDPDGNDTADLCGESVAQSGVRILVTQIASGVPVPVAGVDDIRIVSKGKNTPSPISLRFTNVPVSAANVCGRSIQYHVDQETLPSTATVGSNPQSSYEASAKEGNLQSTETFGLGQCAFRDFQIQLLASGANPCILKQKGESCTTDGECCSGNCSGSVGKKTCK